LCPKGDSAEAYRKYLGKPDARLFFEPGIDTAFIEPFDGAPITLRNRTGGRENMFGVEKAWSQNRCLLVVADWPDGRQTLRVADAPDGRKSREMTVTLP